MNIFLGLETKHILFTLANIKPQYRQLVKLNMQKKKIYLEELNSKSKNFFMYFGRH